MVSRNTLRTVGRVALIVGAVMVLAGLVIGGGPYDFGHGLTIAEVLVRAALIGVGALLVAGGRKALARHRLMGATSLDATLAADLRPPVLYLRSFEDDEDAGRFAELPAGYFGAVGGATVGAVISSLGTLRTEEEQIGRAFAAIGPFVAVRQPGRETAQLGAARSSFADEQWRREVADLIAKSARVVLRAGFGEGLRWEIEKTVELVNPERVILLAPFGMAKYEAFLRFASSLFPRGLPEQTVPWVPLPNFAGVVLFDAEWSPRFVPLRVPLGGYSVVERALKQALERGEPGRPMWGAYKRQRAKGRLSFASTSKEFSFHLDEGARDMHLRLLVDRSDPAMGAGRERVELYLDGARLGARLDTAQLRDGYELALPDARQLRIQRPGKDIKVWLDGKPVAPS
jgi:hypothetical protein